MNKIVKIGFDLDGVFINHPPFVPKAMIEFLYKKKNKHLSYRMPGNLEKTIRIVSHAPSFRPPIKSNIDALQKLSTDKNYNSYLISSRFSFLKKRTQEWITKNNLDKYFLDMYFNYKDLQPHIFKDKMIKKENIMLYIDDDIDLLFYLANQNPKVLFYWVGEKKDSRQFPANLKHVNHIEELRRKYL